MNHKMHTYIRPWERSSCHQPAEVCEYTCPSVWPEFHRQATEAQLLRYARISLESLHLLLYDSNLVLLTLLVCSSRHYLWPYSKTVLCSKFSLVSRYSPLCFTLVYPLYVKICTRPTMHRRYPVEVERLCVSTRTTLTSATNRLEARFAILTSAKGHHSTGRRERQGLGRSSKWSRSAISR